MRRIVKAGALAFALAAAACSKNAASGAPDAEAEPEAAASAAEALSAAPDAAPVDAAAPVVHHRGLAGMFFRAALETELSDDAKDAVEKLEDPIRNDPGPRHEVSTFHSDLAASLKANRFDNAKLQADEAAFAKAVQSRQDDQATALNGLHAALTADQRKAVVESLRTAQGSHERPPIAGGDAGASEWVAHRLERMKSQLVLDLDQQKEVAAVLAHNAPPPASALQAHFDAMKKQMDTLLAAFEKDAFDAKKLDLSPTPGKKPAEPLDRQVKYLEQLLPILTAGQRDRLALSIERPREMRGGRLDTITEPFEMSSGPR